MNERKPKNLVLIFIMSIILPSGFLWNCKAEAANCEPLVGQICLMAFNWAPEGWAECNGTVLNSSSNPILANVLSNRFGGNGTTTFALPNLQSSVAGAKYYIATQGLYPGMDFNIDALYGQIELFPYTCSSEYWARCEGQTLAVSEYQGLYNVIGNKFGGTAGKDFKLPDLRGAAPDANLHYYICLFGNNPVQSEGSYSSSNMYDNYVGSINLYTKDARFESGSRISNGACDGSALSYVYDPVLYALIGTTYGGSGTAFNKPDLRGAEPDPRLCYYVQVGGIFPTRP